MNRFIPGDSVIITPTGEIGEVTAVVPGNGSFVWYFVKAENGTEDRWREQDLQFERDS